MRWGIYALLITGLTLLSWDLVLTLRSKPLMDVQTAPARQVIARNQVDLIPAGWLFGVSATKLSTAPLSATAATDAKLVGIIAADDPSDSLAIIETGEDEKIFAVGSALPDGEVLKSVTSTGITLASGQGQRDLALAQQQAPMDAVFATLPVQITTGDGSAPQPAGPPPKPAPVIPMAQQMTALRQAALQVLAERARHAPASPSHTPPD